MPVLDLTRTGTGLAHEFERVVDATRLSDGSIVLADAGAHEVRRFSPSGTHVWTIGREGDGPGDFAQLVAVAAYRAESLVVFDYWLGRASVLDGAGNIGRSFYPYQPGPGIEQFMPLGDSVFVAQVASYAATKERKALFRIPATIVTVASAGSVEDTLVTVPGLETFILPTGDMRPLFPRGVHLTADDTAVYVGSAERMEYLVFSSDGRLRSIVRAPMDLSLGPDEIQRERDFMLGPNPPARARDMVAALPDPESRPAYARMIADSRGAVWTAAFRGWADTVGATRWQVFSPSGEWLGGIDLPRRLSVLEIGDDYVLGVLADSLDVEHVQVLPLRRQRTVAAFQGGEAQPH